MRFKDKVVIVTGAASGIGRRIMHDFVQEGAFAVVADINGPKAHEAKAETGEKSGQVMVSETDIVDQAAVQQMVADTLNRFGQIDILINNAGVSGEVPFLEMSRQEWERVLQVNLSGQFLTAQAVSRAMVDRGSKGKIVNITSVNAKVAAQGLSHYCASKGGLQMLTRVMALELAPYRINVNAVAPGIIDTPLTASTLADPDKKQRLINKVPWDRIGQPSDIAKTVLFLTSEDADYITGATYNVDGGWLVE